MPEKFPFQLLSISVSSLVSLQNQHLLATQSVSPSFVKEEAIPSLMPCPLLSELKPMRVFPDEHTSVKYPPLDDTRHMQCVIRTLRLHNSDQHIRGGLARTRLSC